MGQGVEDVGKREAGEEGLMGIILHPIGLKNCSSSFFHNHKS
jgi:hypothetical protein